MKQRLTDHGQTATEYLGVLILVAVIIGVVVTSGIGDMIYSAIASAVDAVAGSSDEVDIDTDNTPGDGDDADDDSDD